MPRSTDYASLSEKVFQTLYSDILEGKYEDGDYLVETRLAEELGVSRTPIREALKQLERENLVTALPNRGVIVRKVSGKDLADICTIRALLEGQAAYWAAERADDSHLRSMLETIELMDLYTRRGDFDRLLQYDSVFHEAVYDATGSTDIRNLLTNIHHIIRGRRRSSYTVEGRAERSLEEHRQIYMAIAAHDAPLAKERAENHIRNATETFSNLPVKK